MARKSSKTAHVMNLLAGGEAEISKTEAAQENISANNTQKADGTIKELTVLAQEAAAPSPATSSISIINMSSSIPDPVAEKIRQNLEEEESKVRMENEESDEAASGKASDNSPETPSLPPAIPSFQYVNVMEQVVDGRAEEYMKKLGICTCSRCAADVKALSLTHLPAKYIVAEPPTVSPLLNFYSTKYSQQVIVELTKACSVIKENPHH